MQPSQDLINAYNLGRKLQGKTWEEIIYGDMVPTYDILDLEANLFLNCGLRGLDMPRWVTGWRFGHIPESGRSYNYRDSKPEKGVSVMALDDDDARPADKVSALFIAAERRPVVKVAGWLNPFATGSDGEPLLVGAVEIKNKREA
jgi:hypothetical protein